MTKNADPYPKQHACRTGEKKRNSKRFTGFLRAILKLWLVFCKQALTLIIKKIYLLQSGEPVHGNSSGQAEPAQNHRQVATRAYNLLPQQIDRYTPRGEGRTRSLSREFYPVSQVIS